MANLSGNLREAGVTAVNTGYAVTMANHNSVLDVTATGGAVAVTLPGASTVGNGFHVVIQRNSASDSNVTVGSPISATLSASDSVCELYSDGANWLRLARGGGAPAAHASSHASAGSDEVTPLAIGAQVLHGFVDRSATIAFNDGTRKLTITPSTSFSFWVNGVKYTKTVAQEVTIDNTAGLHYCYEDANGALQKSMDAWDIAGLTAIPAAIVWWNGSAGRLWEERHGYRRNPAWHKTQHLTEGAKYYSGLGLTLPTTGTPGDFQVESGYIFDEDLDLTIGQQTQCLICYRTGGGAAMTFDGTLSNVPYKLNGANLRYDLSGVLTDAASNNYINYYLYLTNDTGCAAYVVLGQAAHTTLAAARAEGRPTIPMSTAEWVLAYKLTYRNTGTPSFIEATDYRNVQSGPPVNYSAPTTVAATNVLVDATSFTGVLSGKTTAQAAFAAIDTMASVRETVTITHSFAAGDVVYRKSDSTWAKAKADAVATAEAVGVIESVSTTVSFVVVYSGKITVSGASWTDGSVYFLSASTAGALTDTEPSTVGYVSRPILVATSSTTGIVMQYRGMVVGPGMSTIQQWLGY